MKPFFYRRALTLGVLTLLGGCGTNNMDSWLGRGNVTRNGGTSQTDEAPPPKAAPTEPVQSVMLPPGAVRPAIAPPLVTQAVSSASTSKTKIAILLPLSGKNASLGQAMLNAAQMAVFDMSGGNFELMPRDTDGSEASATAAAHDAVASGAQLIIGPLFAAQVPGVKTVAETAGVSMLTLSTDTSLAGPGVFVMGFAPGAQVDRVVGYAATQGVKRYAALVPDSPYGALVAQVFRQAVARTGGVVADLQTYDPVQHNSAAAVSALSVYRERIDALFLPEGGDDLKRIAEELAAAGFDNHRIRFLGTGLWDETNLGKHVSFLIGGWYAASDPAARRNFVNAYVHSYGQEPPRLATLAYDATAMAAVLVRRGERFDRAALTNPNGFAGVDGIFRLTDQGFVERGLAVDEVTPAEERVVAPAPATFASAR